MHVEEDTHEQDERYEITIGISIGYSASSQVEKKDEIASEQ